MHSHAGKKARRTSGDSSVPQIRPNCQPITQAEEMRKTAETMKTSKNSEGRRGKGGRLGGSALEGRRNPVWGFLTVNGFKILLAGGTPHAYAEQPQTPGGQNLAPDIQLQDPTSPLGPFRCSGNLEVMGGLAGMSIQSIPPLSGLQTSLDSIQK